MSLSLKNFITLNTEYKIYTKYVEKYLKEVSQSLLINNLFDQNSIFNEFLKYTLTGGRLIRSRIFINLFGFNLNKILEHLESVDISRKETFEKCKSICCSIEMIHLATLLHDDIIDDSKSRRGQISSYLKFSTKLSILGGDYLVSKGLKMIVDLKNDKIVSIIINSINQLIQGEIEQMEKSCSYENVSIEEYYSIINKKTAKLFLASGQAALELALEATKSTSFCELNSLRQVVEYICLELGSVFQLVDDCNDFFRNDTGKDQFNDLLNKRYTLPIFILSEDKKAKKYIDLIFSKDNLDIEYIRKCFLEIFPEIKSEERCSSLESEIKRHFDHLFDIYKVREKIKNFFDKKFSMFVSRLDFVDNNNYTKAIIDIYKETISGYI